MTSLLERVRLLLDIPRLRHQLNRRRRLVTTILAGVGVLLLVTAIRTPGSSPELSPHANVSLSPGEVAVPVVISPSGAVATLTPGSVVDLIREGATAPVVQGARVIEIPTSGFGPSSDTIAIVALTRATALSLASHPSEPVGVMIHGRE